MNSVFWLLQIALFVKFLSVAYTHGLSKNSQDMKKSVSRLGMYGMLLHRATSLLSAAGAAGILIPSLAGMNNLVTAFSAVFLAVIMVPAIIFHIRSREKPKVWADTILLLLCAFTAYGRMVLQPL
jgi:hypothetical protein